MKNAKTANLFERNQLRFEHCPSSSNWERLGIQQEEQMWIPSLVSLVPPAIVTWTHKECKQIERKHYWADNNILTLDAILTMGL